jgi:hypothetical protein
MTESQIIEKLENVERFLYLVTSQMQECVTEIVKDLLDQMNPGREEPQSRKLLKKTMENILHGVEAAPPIRERLHIVPPPKSDTSSRFPDGCNPTRRASLRMVSPGNRDRNRI